MEATAKLLETNPLFAPSSDFSWRITFFGFLEVPLLI